MKSYLFLFTYYKKDLAFLPLLTAQTISRSKSTNCNFCKHIKNNEQKTSKF